VKNKNILVAYSLSFGEKIHQFLFGGGGLWPFTPKSLLGSLLLIQPNVRKLGKKKHQFEQHNPPPPPLPLFNLKFFFIKIEIFIS
jgi:hypothetical protein